MAVGGTPGAGRDEVQVEGESVQIRVTSPPADGAANEAVLRLLAAALARPRRDLTLLREATARIQLLGIATSRSRRVNPFEGAQQTRRAQGSHGPRRKGGVVGTGG